MSAISVGTTQPEFIEFDRTTDFSPNFSPVSVNMALVDSHYQEETRNSSCFNETFNHDTNMMTNFFNFLCRISISFTKEDSSKNKCEIKPELDVSNEDSNRSFHDLENAC